MSYLNSVPAAPAGGERASAPSRRMVGTHLGKPGPLPFCTLSRLHCWHLLLLHQTEGCPHTCPICSFLCAPALSHPSGTQPFA